MRRLAASSLAALSLIVAPAASAYGWPLKPFNRPHPIRGTFGDPRFHLSAEASLSAFHFGVDIAARDGTRVYAVEPGVVLRRYATSVTIESSSGRRFSYWRVRPVAVAAARTFGSPAPRAHHSKVGGASVSAQFFGYFRDPLRKGALTPFHRPHHPRWSRRFRSSRADGPPIDPQHVSGAIDVLADIYDPASVAPRPRGRSHGSRRQRCGGI